MIWGEEVKLVSVATTNAVKNTTGNTRAYSMNFIQIQAYLNVVLSLVCRTLTKFK